MDLIDQFKSLAFIHSRHTDYDAFHCHLNLLASQGLSGYLTTQLAQHLTEAGILDNDHLDDLHHNIYSRFYRFWLAAVPALAEAGFFTFEDQKYYAYLDELGILTEFATNGPPPTYNHILVDEFQDINPLDLSLVKAIRERTNATLTIVGDDDQAIYEFRAGTPEYILNPTAIFDIPFETTTLQVNYRSPENVIRTSQQLIGHNTRRVQKDTRSQPSPPEDAVIEVIRPKGDIDSLHELDLLRDDAVRNGIDPGQIAVLTRRNDQLVNPQLYFMTEKIHIAVALDQQLTNSDSYRQLVELLRIKAESDHPKTANEARGAILDLLRAAMDAGVSRAARGLIRQSLPTQERLSVRDAVYSVADSFDSSSFTATRFRQVRDASLAAEELIEAKNVVDALDVLERSFEMFKVTGEEGEGDIFRAAPPFKHLKSHAHRFGAEASAFVRFLEDSAREYVHDLAELRAEDESDRSGVEFRPILIMTAHRAKGREFDYVILPDVVDGIWPSGKQETPEEKEGERRVFYVAFTRARKRISLLVNRDRGLAQSPYIAELGL